MRFAQSSRHNGVHFLDIATSKSGPELMCFVHFDFEMCFAPQRRALFRHRNFQKWSENGVLCTFWLRNVLRATTACTFWTSSQLFDLEMCFAPQRRALFERLNFQKCSEPVSFLHFWLGNVLRATTACHFSSLIWPAGSAPAALASLFSTLRSHKSLKNTVFRDFPTFSRTWIFFLLRLSLFWSSLFCSSLLYSSAPPLLFICPYCRKFDF